MTRIAINGFGRIGRCLLRALHERGADTGLDLVAVNEPADAESIAYLTRYDTTHGRFPGEVSLRGEQLLAAKYRISLSHEFSPERMPWRATEVDMVLECSGAFTDREAAEGHIKAGAGRVLFSQPAEPDVDATIIAGVNTDQLEVGHRIVSAGSCTTNCVLPPILLLDQAFGIEAGSIRTLHAAMNDQPVMDAYHNSDLRKTRAAFESMIPVETGLARGIERVLPQMAGRFSARAMRVPLSDVSAIDLTLQLRKAVSVDAVNHCLREAAESGMRGILGYTEEPLVSCDFVHDPRSAVVDGSQTSIAGDRLVKLLLWFDNEWGFANRMLDVAAHWARLGNQQ